LLHLLFLVPLLPFCGFVVLALAGRWLTKTQVALVGVGSVGLSAVIAVCISLNFVADAPAGDAFSQSIWTWINVGGFSPHIAFYLDSLSVIMILVVTVVGFLIHLYSAEYMEDEPDGYARFFACMNLFVGSMLTLVLADNLLLLYLGWEGVGLCSYLLIGFWYTDPVNGRAARKAFTVTRVGDTAMLVGLLLLFTKLGTLQIQPLMQAAETHWVVGSSITVAAAGLLLGGALGKSAQLPLQTWLPDAMAGPTPVSALIHAATMVTAGVYLIARMNVLFTMSPVIHTTVAAVGAGTLILAGFSALVQRDIKRVLAYSTISQIGYMFLAVGVGAWSAAMFHFMTHAFFKALLFMGAGVVILGEHHEQDMFKMGGLRREAPLLFWTFLAGSLSLVALPLVTAGFYSKDAILAGAWASDAGGRWLWAAGFGGALLTSLYTFRMVFYTFFGEVRTPFHLKPGVRLMLPLVVLAFLSIVGGYLDLPRTLGNHPWFSDFMHTSLPETKELATSTERNLQMSAAAISIVGILLAYYFFLREPGLVRRLAMTPVGAALHRFWFVGWGFDWVYDNLIVGTYVRVSRANRSDVFDLPIRGAALISQGGNIALSWSETGQLRWYAASVAFGAIVAIGIVVFFA
jgi:NADH-quinone oxidoreductase subunit L